MIKINETNAILDSFLPFSSMFTDENLMNKNKLI